MPYRLLFTPLYNAVESIVDGCRYKVTPAIGSVLYCDLALGYMDHSGIYIGDNRIVHLTRSGKIEITTPRGFVDGGTAVHIYVSCCDEWSTGSQLVADRARTSVGFKRNYNFLVDNCHQFAAGCLTGNFEKQENFLWMLKDTASKTINANSWRYWDIQLF